jgi:uncharacterized membrane protein
MKRSGVPVTFFAAFYASEAKARAMLHALEASTTNNGTELQDAALVERSGEGSQLRVVERMVPGGPIDAIFPKAILALSAVGSPATAAMGHFTEFGFTTNLLREIGENLPPKGAAVIAVVEERWLQAVAAALSESSDLARYPLDLEATAHLLDQSKRRPNAT